MRCAATGKLTETPSSPVNTATTDADASAVTGCAVCGGLAALALTDKPATLNKNASVRSNGVKSLVIAVSLKDPAMMRALDHATLCAPSDDTGV